MESQTTSKYSIDTKGLPNFIIIGAMKSGTTSVHSILAHHQDVFMPKKEVYFFDVDDIDQHPDFFVPNNNQWTFHDFDRDFHKYLEWYKNMFSQAVPGQIIGEDTTTYLASTVAAGRISKILPEVKLIAMLRDPVTRAYSHYWHNVTAGRMINSFEHTLRFSPGTLFERGNYFEQLSRYQSFIDAGKLKVVFFEEFLQNPQKITDELCEYIGLPSSVDVSTIETQKNASSAPLSLSLRLIGNRAYSSIVRSRKSFRNIPNMPRYHMATEDEKPKKESSIVTGYQALANRMPKRKYPPMNPGTKEFLQKLFKKRNSQLSQLIGRNVSQYWEYMK